MSVQPKVSLGGFEITPPVVLWLKCGSGPVHINGQHLVAVEEDAESEDEEEDVILLSMLRKRSALESGSKVPQKKVKLAADEDDEDDDDDDFDNEEAEENAPVKKSIRDILQAKMHKNQTRMEKTINTKIKRSRILQKTGKIS
uniref:Nucleophosmin n=1 Tax=Molossus molossus TaxID=27622 RepID=A0A7J8J7L2_MOLMO|nr:hypothetical protein HJG59_009603 [Molossus molossus]